MADLIEAYLDDYHLIHIEQVKKFHQGNSDEFFLSLGQLREKLEIIEKQEYQDKIIYTVTFKQEIEMGKQYIVYGQDNYSTNLTYRFIVKTVKFNQDYYYDGDDLGSIVSQKETTFKLWAPTASAVLLKLEDKVYTMQRLEKGIYYYKFNKRLLNKEYSYLVFVNGQVHESLDPYGKITNYDNNRSITTQLKESQKIELKTFGQNSDQIVYEANVADYSASGDFIGFIKQLPYLKDLGITVLQLMPINSYGGIDNYHTKETYNFGYNPLAFQSLQVSYGTNQQFAKLVESCHKYEIRLVLDVVFNHHYKADYSSFSYCVPYYYFRYDQDNKLAEGSYCGSEFASEMRMCRKYFVDTCLYFVKYFDVDGFRFDLMGLIDYQTINEIKKQCQKIKTDIMLYGEGWNMASGLDAGLLANMNNYQKLDQIAFFNDQFRNTISGNSFQLNKAGYCSGDIWQVKQAMDCLVSERFEDSNLSINYCQCHDNYTSFDKINACCENENQQEKIKRQKLMLACVLLSRGISFIHCGQEYCSSKNFMSDSYNVVGINSFKKDNRYQEVADYCGYLISLKKKYHINATSTYRISEYDCVIIYQVNGLLVLINPLNEDKIIKLDKEYVVKEKEILIIEND